MTTSATWQERTPLVRKCLGLATAVLAMLGALVSTPAAAQLNSSVPLKMVVPYTAGTGPDTVARVLIEPLRERLGQSVVVDNRPGASGNIGAVAVVRANPDGHTLLLAASTLVTAALLNAAAGFDPIRDLTPVSLVARSNLMLAANANGNIKNLSELISAAKANPGKVTYSSPGVGTPHHMAMQLLEHSAGIKLMHVPYKGTSGAVTDLMGGQVDVAFLGVSVAIPALESGRIRALGVSAPKRDVHAPSVPTFQESGVREADSDMWFAIFGPKGLDAGSVSRINAAVVSALQNEKVKQALATAGLEPASSSPDALGQLVRQDHARWSQIIRAVGVTGGN